MEDADLVVAIRGGDQHAWDQLVDRHSGFLYRLARSVAGSHEIAEDAMQTGWMQLLRSIDTLQNPSAVRSWLATTVRREAIALSTARRRDEPAELDDWGIAEPGDPGADLTGDAVARNEEHGIVFAALEKLTAKCRTLLLMYAEKLAYREISDILDMPIGSIGPTRQRCLDNLRKQPGIGNLEVLHG